MQKLNKILLIDDNETTSYYHKFIIKKLNICEHLEEYANVTNALDYLSNKNKELQYPCPELFFLDVNMPKMCGFDFLDSFSKLSEKGGTKIVMISTIKLRKNVLKAKSFKEVVGMETKPLEQDSLKIIEDKLKLFIAS